MFLNFQCVESENIDQNILDENAARVDDTQKSLAVEY